MSLKWVFNPFTGKLDATNDLSSGDAANDLLYYCADDLKFYRLSVVIEPEMQKPTIGFTAVSIWRNWIDEAGNFLIDESSNQLGETF